MNEVTKPATLGGRGTEDLILTHAALVALTPLVPLPFVDDLARRGLRRRLVRQLAEHRDQELSDEAVQALGEDRDGLLGKHFGRRLLLMPVKWVFKRVLLALRGKAIVDAASDALHRGVLLDASLAHGLVARHGAPAIVDAVEALLKAEPVADSPVTAAFRAGIRASQDALSATYEVLREALREGSVDAGLRQAATTLQDRGGLDGLRRAFLPQPRAHLDRLEEKLLARLP